MYSRALIHCDKYIIIAWVSIGISTLGRHKNGYYNILYTFVHVLYNLYYTIKQYVIVVLRGRAECRRCIEEIL